MYFAKARKQMEEQDMREVEENLEKYQRSDTARVLQQAKGPRTEDCSSRQAARPDFRPDELPDGAFVSPKHTPTHSSAAAKSDGLTVTRPAEYIGSFSVTGSDEEARAKQVETQLEALRTVRKSKKVLVAISLAGIKVCSSDGQSVYMLHDLKRISYATCDPDHCQFSYLARERQMNIQYCHAFVTQTPEQAEELNTIIGNAFKMAYAQQRDHQPTFHELIEAQVAEQRAKFLEIEKQAQVELQWKLAEIARPTPFSERAQQRMELRRQLMDERELSKDLIVGQNKLWAKQAVDKVHHRISLNERLRGSDETTLHYIEARFSDPQIMPLIEVRSSMESFSSYSKGESGGGGRSHAHKNVTKHNSAPLFPAQVMSPSDEPPTQGENVSCVIPHHPLSAQAIRVSMETKKDTKFKGSPVTALKNEIDRRFLFNGSETVPLETASSSMCLQGVERETDQRAIRHEQVRHQIHMAGRPLPTVPSTSSPHQNSNVNNGSKPSPRQRPTSSYHWRSFDDHNILPSSSSSPAPLSSSSKQSNGVAIRNSPRRKQPRPLSEIATGSSGGMIVGGGGSKGYDNWNLPGFPENSSETSPFSSPHHRLISAHAGATPPPLSSSQAGVEGGVYIYGPTPGGVMAEMRAGGKGPRFDSSQRTSETPERSPQKSNGQEQRGPASRGSNCASGNTEVVLRYQNDSPFHVEDQEAVGRARQGLQSLMCLDRSHIEDPALRQAPWYQAGIPREIALEILQQEEVGSFIVRDSTTHPGCFALSVRVPKFENTAGISHYLILKTQRGVKLKGLDKEWPNLTALVTHHTVMPEMLPCTLRLPRNNKNLTFREAEREDPDDETYQRLTDVTAMAGQLKL